MPCLPAFHPSFDQLFEFGIDPDPGALPRDGPADWPAEGEIRQYSFRTRQALDRLMADAPAEIVEAALEHRLMHAETLAYLLHNLPYAAKVLPAAQPSIASQNISNPMIDIAAGVATLGKHVDDTFGWDNEYSQHSVEVGAFRCSQYKVTNGEYLQFVEAGAPGSAFLVTAEG